MEPNDNGRYEGGTLTVAGGGTYTIIDNIDVFGDDDVWTSTAIAAADEDKTGTLVDDDQTHPARVVDTSKINAKFKIAYIVAATVASATDLTNDFIATTDSTEDQAEDIGQENRDLATSADYWVAGFVSCHQGSNGNPAASTVDGDPDVFYHVHGATVKNGDTSFVSGQTPVTSGYNVSLIFLEVARDYAAQSPGFLPADRATAAEIEQATVLHELGHQFGLTPATHNDTGTIMQLGALHPTLNFNDSHINTIRTSTAIEN